MDRYELIVIGSGPAGEKAAVKAAYFGHKVALVERAPYFGGAGVATGTLPSKTLKETALYLSGRYDKGLYGVDRDIAGDASIENFMFRKDFIIQTESDVVHRNLQQHHVDIFHGEASFVDKNTVHVDGPKEVDLQADNILIATGSYPFHPDNIPFDHKRVLDSDTILNIKEFPQSIAVLGAGVIGCEYATIFSTMGTKVFLINRGNEILPFIDKEIVAEFQDSMEHDQIDLMLEKNVKEIHIPKDDEQKLEVILESGELLHTDMFLFAAGRCGATQNLALEKVGITVDKRQAIEVNENYQTSVPNIYAVGDVIGFPALASTGMDQGRVAVAHIFQTKDIEELARVLPYGIYTVPEISAAGISEEEAIDQGLNYCKGVAHHKDMPRGKIMGAKRGILKIIFTKDDLIIRGVHIVGHLATELIHHGMGLIENKKSLMDIIGNVYNYPTLHDMYKYAAYDGLGNLAGHKVKT
ncbi:MAG: putative soluble pyridine nucleotide transhydrogenase [Chlamydiales bacterium]|nr:putative soluble pyridine nucleotide transhydrogenase [Chlamydiales bacterium]MCH9635686.1 putative soluble pyridine nucleotide transhydrogenase [Chlamydiales bacterium]